MSKKIIKINNLDKIEGFLQLNYSKGFKYVDKAGEFVNHLHKNNKFPKHTMQPTGMIVEIDKKTQLKTSPLNLWMHFVEPVSFKYQRQEFIEKAELVNNIFEPEKYTRIGWRNYLMYECGNSFPDILPKDFLQDSSFNEIVLSKKIDELKLRISISKLEEKMAENKAILFDIDIYTEKEIERNDFGEISSILENIEKTYNSSELLDFINKILA